MLADRVGHLPVSELVPVARGMGYCKWAGPVVRSAPPCSAYGFHPCVSGGCFTSCHRICIPDGRKEARAKGANVSFLLEEQSRRDMHT